MIRDFTAGNSLVVDGKEYRRRKVFHLIDLNSGLLNETEAAQRLGISKQSLMRLRNARKIGFYRIGKRVLYGPQHLDRYLAASNREGGQDDV